MELRFYGNTAFGMKNKDFMLAINPGAKSDPKPDIVLLSHPSDMKLTGESVRVIDEPGEYEIKGLFVYGIAQLAGSEQNLIFKLEYNNRHICYLPVTAKLSEKQLGDIGLVDVLVLPLQSEGLELKEIKELVEEIDPRVVVAYDPKQSGSPLDSKMVQDFLKVMNKTDVQPVELLQVDRYPYNEEKTDIVLLQTGGNS